MYLRTVHHVRPLLPVAGPRSWTVLHVRFLHVRPGQGKASSRSTNSGQDSGANDQGLGQPVSQTPADVSSALSSLDPSQNQLLAPVHVPEDKNAVLKSDHPATNILAQSGLVVTRQIEMMNLFLGFEQANRYVIMDPQGNHIGYMAEHDGGIAKTMGRQWFRTHRAFTTHVFDRHAREVLRFHRPFSFINSRIRVYDALEAGVYTQRSSETAISTDLKNSTIDGIHATSSLPLEAMRIIGEAHSEWAPLRRKYNLFLAHELDSVSPEPGSQMAGAIGSEPVPSDLPTQQQRQVNQSSNFSQFAYVDEPWLSWDFSLKGADGKLLGSVNRNWRGFGRELFTDTGMYVLRMDAAALDEEAQNSHPISQTNQSERAYGSVLNPGQDAVGMTLDQRALMLATAVTVDFDYFSRHSSSGSGMFLPVWMGSGGASAEAGAAGAAGAGAAEAGVAVGAGRAAGAAGSLGAGEGAIAGAGTMAGYEAMQRGMGRGDSPADSGSQSTPNGGPDSPGQYGSYNDPDSPQYGGGSDAPSPQSDYGQPPESQDAWGSGDADPWQGDAGQQAGDGDGEGGGGLLSSLWDSFFGD